MGTCASSCGALRTRTSRSGSGSSRATSNFTRPALPMRRSRRPGAACGPAAKDFISPWWRWMSSDTPIGLAHVLFHRSTWSPTTYCYLEDLFVDPARRKTGAGRALIEATYREADARGRHAHLLEHAGVQLHGPCAVRPAGNQVAICAVSALTQAICELALGGAGHAPSVGQRGNLSSALLAGAREASAVVALSPSAIAGASGTRSFVAACGDAVVPATALKFSNWG